MTKETKELFVFVSLKKIEVRIRIQESFFIDFGRKDILILSWDVFFTVLVVNCMNWFMNLVFFRILGSKTKTAIVFNFSI